MATVRTSGLYPRFQPVIDAQEEQSRLMTACQPTIRRGNTHSSSNYFVVQCHEPAAEYCSARNLLVIWPLIDNLCKGAIVHETQAGPSRIKRNTGVARIRCRSGRD